MYSLTEVRSEKKNCFLSKIENYFISFFGLVILYIKKSFKI